MYKTEKEKESWYIFHRTYTCCMKMFWFQLKFCFFVSPNDLNIRGKIKRTQNRARPFLSSEYTSQVWCFPTLLYPKYKPAEARAKIRQKTTEIDPGLPPRDKCDWNFDRLAWATGEYLFPLNVIRGWEGLGLFILTRRYRTSRDVETDGAAGHEDDGGKEGEGREKGESREPKNKREKMKINWSK